MSLCPTFLRRIHRAGLWLTILFIAHAELFAAPALAQEGRIRVFRDEYVVEANVTVSAFGGGDISIPGTQSIRNLGGAHLLVKPPTARGGVSAAYSESAVSETVELDPDDTFCSDLLKRGVAKTCSPNYEMRASAVPNDPQFGGLWGLSTEKGIDAPRAWDSTTGSAQTVVAVIDTGVDYTHPDLHANMWVNPWEVPGNGVDDDSNGFIDDVHGMNAISRSGNPMDDNGHGTHVAGTIGAAGNNAVGVAGISWNVRIMGLKFLASNGSGSLSGAIEAINYIVAMKAKGVNVRVMNNSWGGGGFSQTLFNAIVRARDAGIIFVAAAGNESNDNDANPTYPSSYDVDSVVSVAAIDQNQNAASFSNYGANSVDIAAPGVGILSTYPGNRYSSLSGTSMATPHVAGALGLLLSSNPALTNGQAIELLYNSGVAMSSLAGVVRTGRKLNVARMVYGQTEPIPAPAPTPPPCDYGVEEIAFAPDLSADGTAVIAQGDEFNFHRLDLPFSFTYFGKTETSVTISPNGVAYVGYTPTAMDYQNSAHAPLHGIASLQSDLVADASPYGVRAAVGADRVTIFWFTNHYSKRGQGDVLIRTTIYQSGVIENFVDFGSAAVEAHVRERATIGITGSAVNQTKTFASNSAAIRSQLGIRYTPVCGGGNGGGGSPQLSRILLEGRGDGKWRTTVGAGSKMRVRMNGSGSGKVPVSLALNGKVCETKPEFDFSNGASIIIGFAPVDSGFYRTMDVQAPGVKDGAKIVKTAAFRRVKQSRKKSRAARFDVLCSKIIGSMSIAK